MRTSPRPSNASIVAKLRGALAAQRINVLAIDLKSAVAELYYENYYYFSEADAINRISRLLIAKAPPDIEEFRLYLTTADRVVREFDLLRSPAEREYLNQAETNFVTIASAHDAPLSADTSLWRATRRSFPQFNWSIFPQFRQALFDPNNLFGVQFLVVASASLELLPGLSLQGQADASLFDDFPTGRLSDSVLPHVRTDFLHYFTKGKNGISDLKAEYQFRLAPDVYAAVRAGYLESMFAGVGGEVLWRPDGLRWALGADFYSVKQRAFDRLLGLQPYRVFTGHVTVYYASPWYDLNFAVSAGQYLAGDRGLTFEMTRRFAGGVEVGAFFTKTNVSTQRFGEGSFDKGISIRIPLSFMLPINSQSKIRQIIRPVQRDGGQRLGGGAMLYEATRRSSPAEMMLVTGNSGN